MWPASILLSLFHQIKNSLTACNTTYFHMISNKLQRHVMKKLLLSILFCTTLYAESLPICGVLTQQGYHKLNFLVPYSSTGKEVKRYEVIDTASQVPPLEVMAGWWICVTAGKIIAEPTEESYGRIEILSYETTQTNAERGQE